MRGNLIAKPARGALLAAILACTVAGAPLAGAAPTAWQDDATGFAIAGFDPVAYYTRHKPLLGEAGIEHRWGGVVWRFANIGNKEAFAKHPRAYLPLFAGYDPEALSRGLAVRGSPAVWLLHEGRIVFFRDMPAMRAWAKNPQRLAGLAETNWKRLSRDIPGTSGY